MCQNEVVLVISDRGDRPWTGLAELEKRNKNDAADAEALCEAMSRPTMRFVPVKTAGQQAALMLVGVRDRMIRNRTQLSNAVRGHAAEFGLTAAQGDGSPGSATRTYRGR
jgi:transposase